MEKHALCAEARSWFNVKMPSYHYRKSHCGDKTILRPSYLYNGISHTGKVASLYWIRFQESRYQDKDLNIKIKKGHYSEIWWFSNEQHFDYLFNSFSRLTKIKQQCSTGLSLMEIYLSEFPWQTASYVKVVPMSYVIMSCAYGDHVVLYVIPRRYSKFDETREYKEQAHHTICVD